MKPIKLTFQAFGTFPSTVEIDFEKLSSGGIFLISGETGSGKTTIFDAICYALYGEANGKDRDSKNFRSDFVDGHIDTYVKLVFECRGERYEIYRSPEYTKIRELKKGGEKESNHPYEVYLIKPNGETIEKITEVNKAIESILGLSCEQFRQIVMIAQGEFKRFLLADSETKGKILNSVFGTQRFVDFEKALAIKKVDANKAYVDSLNSSIGDILSIRYGTDWDYHQEFEKWKTLKNEDKNIEVVLESLKTYLDTLKLEDTQLSETISTLEEEVSKISSEVNAHTNMNQNILKRDSLVKDLEKINSQKPKIDSLRVQLKTLDNAKSIEVQRLQYTSADKNVTQLNSSKALKVSQLVECENAVELLGKQKLDICNALKISSSSEDVSIEANNMLNALKSQLADIETQGKEYKTIIDKINAYTMELSNLTIQQQTLVEKTNHKTELSQNYLEKEQLYNLNIAGVLAESLQEGMPCMVCGSVHHPNVAVKHQDAPSEGQLKMLKAELDDVEEKFRVFQTKYLVHKKELENTQNDILESVSKFGISSNDIPEILQTLNSKRNGLRVQYSTLKNEISTAEQNISKLNRVTQNIQENETTFAVLTTSIEDINEQLQGATLERNTLKDTYLNALKSVNIPDEDIHSQLLEEYCNYKSIESVVANFENSLANCSIRINEYNNTIGEHSFVDVSKLEVKLAETNQLLQKKRNRSFEVSERIKTNTAICEKVSKDYKEVIKKYQIYKDTEYLSQVSNGTLSGVEHRIAFSNYVQAYYFEKVMATANQKIHIMSGGRYSLVRTDDTSSKNKKGGLGVKIFDAYTGKHRASSTLSGGETFMVSLSLALGLSEVVQQQSGGIKIDAMFIDEGFGTLDSEQSLQQAIKVLDSLATNDRVVGIISHVNELKEHITNRLIVEKSPSGSTITY